MALTEPSTDPPEPVPPIRVRARPVRDALRLVHFGDVLSRLGDLLLRRSLRYTLLTVLISLLGYGSKVFGFAGFSARQAVTLPLLVGGTTVTVGLLLKYVPAVLASRRLAVAQAAELNLMEDYRKSRAPEHLDLLWEHVFRFEAGVDPNAPSSPEAFRERALQALAGCRPQTRERYALGIDLHLLEDWYDGAYLDRSDVKLGEQFDGDPHLRYAAALAGYGRIADLPALPDRLVQRLWFLLTTRSVAIDVATAVEALNQRYDTGDFDAQSLLWPGEQDAHWLAQYPGGRAALLAHRARIVKRTFGKTPHRTRVMVHRLFGADLRRAIRLRMRIDARWLAGELGDPEALLGGTPPAAPPPLVRRTRWLAGRVRLWLPAWREALDRARAAGEPAGGDPSPRVLRAAEVLLFARTPARVLALPPPAVEALRPAAEQALTEAARCEPRVRAALVQTRLHHVLCHLTLQGYRELVDTLRDSTATG